MAAPESNLKTTIPENEARRVGRRGDVLVPGDILTREWPQLDTQSAKTLLDALKLVKTVTDPKADGVTHEGTFAVSDVSDSTNDERWATIRQVLTLITTSPEDEADLPTAIQGGRAQALRVFTLGEGDNDVKLHTYLYLNPTQEATFVALPITAPSGYTEADRNFSVEELGNRTGTMSILYRKVTWPNALVAKTNIPTTGYVTREDGTQSEFGTGNTKTTTYFGVPVDDAETATEALSTASDNDKIAIGASFQDTGDGSAAVVHRQIGVNTNGTSSERQRGYSIAGTPNRYMRVFPSMTSAKADEVAATLRSGGANHTFTIVQNEVEITYQTVAIQRDVDSVGRVSVVQIAEREHYASDFWQEYYDGQIIYNYRYRQVTGDFVEAVAIKTYCVNLHRFCSSSKGTAIEWVNASSIRPIVRGTNTKHRERGGTFFYASRIGLWIADQEIWTVTPSQCTCDEGGPSACG